MSTIDPGCEDQLKHSANDVEANDADNETNWDKEEEENLMDPGTWWFASTACPLLAGTFGPMANGFSICALVYCWRVYIPPGGTEEHGIKISDPAWALSVNAVSLACALVGNASLLVNMARRLRFSIAQPITITGFSLAGLLLIADMAAISSSRDYFITEVQAEPQGSHALTSAFYYAGFAAGIYIIIAMLMGLTVYGAHKGHYDKDFNLTPSQRTLMLQTMSFIAYLLLGALVFSSIEGWNYLDGVYWADVTLLTVGLGDYVPKTNVGRGLLFPFATCGILIVGLVIGSIRSLVLERGREKMSARIVEKRRETAVRHVNENKQTIRISWFAQAEFSTDPSLSPAQRREEQFYVMRKVQKIADRERRYFSLALSLTFVLVLWFVGALIFKVAEKNQGWTYFESLYFTFVVLVTIGYGDFAPQSNYGRAFFVFWSLLAVPSLTILISNMGDTIVKWFSDITVWIGSITVLPGEEGVRVTTKKMAEQFVRQSYHTASKFTPAGIFGDAPTGRLERITSTDHWNHVLDKLSERLAEHIEDEEVKNIRETSKGDDLVRDMNFYHYVLSRECRNLHKDLSASAPKKYSWGEWEYFLRLMGNRDDSQTFPGQRHPNNLVPEALQVHPLAEAGKSGLGLPQPQDDDEKQDTSPPDSRDSSNSKHITFDTDLDKGQSDGSGDIASTLSMSKANTMSDSTVDGDDEIEKLSKGRRTWTNLSIGHKKKSRSLSRSRTDLEDVIGEWSWLSDESPLMSTKPEPEWLLERLSAALERELNRQRKGYKKRPPISMSLIDRVRKREDKEAGEDTEEGGHDDVAEQEAAENEALGIAALGS